MTPVRLGRPGAVALVIGGLACQEVGASLAVLLFPATGPLGMVMLRLVFSAILLLVVARPSLRGRSAAAWRSVVLFGVVLACMNAFFYLALERLPLGVTVTIEVLGPLTLSVVVSRRLSAWLWAGLALAAAACWAGYILSSARVGRQFSQLDGLAIAMAVGAVLALPLGIVDAGAALLNPVTLGLGAAIAILSSAIPYALELTALRRLPASGFAVLMSLAPATATLAGWILLGQRLTVVELAGIALVIVASVGAVRASGRAADAAARPVG